MLGGAAAGLLTLAATPAEAAERGGGGGGRAADLAPPLFAAGVAGLAGLCGHLRRRRRAETGTRTDGGTERDTTPDHHLPAEGADLPTAELADRARVALAEADDCVQTSREELVFVEAVHGAKETGAYGRAVRQAEAEVRTGLQVLYDSDAREPTGTQDEAARRQALGEALFRAREAGRVLDEGAPGVDQLRGLERGVGDALEAAQTRFRALNRRTGAAARTLARLRGTYPEPAVLPVTRHVEEAQDRLVFTTSQLNRARQAADLGDEDEAVVHLRAAEGAIAQTAVLINGVERLSAELTEAEQLIPATLDHMEPEKPDDSARPDDLARQDDPALRETLDTVRREVALGRYDPLALLRSLVAARPTNGGSYGGDSSDGGPPLTAALHVARSTASATNDFMTCHRGAVGTAARARLAEARGLLARAAEGDGSVTDAREADELALRARQSAEEDVRTYTARHDTMRGGTTVRAMLGGVLLPTGTTTGPGTGVPPCYGGPATRARLSRTPPGTPSGTSAATTPDPQKQEPA